MKQEYIAKDFRGESWELIQLMNDIINDYQAQGFTLTVRQLYYQLVARDIIPNVEKSYKRITGLVNDARMAGYMDWDAIEDRTRAFVRRGHWGSPSEIIEVCVDGYHEDLWTDQPNRVFVIVEKEALVGVLEGVCHDLDIPLLAARGYPSGTVLREFARRDVMDAFDNDQNPVILHLGDHDPSGIDMSRDLEERITLLSEADALGESIEFIRIALTMDQIDEQRPPENPAKSTDARFKDYRKKYGSSSWELDALKPQYLAKLVESYANRYIDEDRWKAAQDRIEDAKLSLRNLAKELR